jgi:membrane fusion protein (multidrug efflux system)
MKNRAVTFVSLAGLVAACALAYYLFGRGFNAEPAIANTPKQDTSAAIAKNATKAAAPAAAGPAPVEVIDLKASVVLEDLQAVGALRSNESVMMRPEVAGSTLP